MENPSVIGLITIGGVYYLTTDITFIWVKGGITVNTQPWLKKENGKNNHNLLYGGSYVAVL